MVKLAKRLKKEKVNVDVVNFGEEVSFEYMILYFITAVHIYRFVMIRLENYGRKVTVSKKLDLVSYMTRIYDVRFMTSQMLLRYVPQWYCMQPFNFYLP